MKIVISLITLFLFSCNQNEIDTSFMPDKFETLEDLNSFLDTTTRTFYYRWATDSSIVQFTDSATGAVFNMQIKPTSTK